MSCPSSYAFQKGGYVDYYAINLLNIKIYEPEKLKDYTNPIIWSISKSSYMYIEKAQYINNVKEDCNRLQNSYTSPYVNINGAETAADRAYWQKVREDVKNGYKIDALKIIKKECICLIENCKNVLIEYNMLEEFKKYNPSMSNFFELKENDITWEIVGNIENFIRGTIMCALSKEADDKYSAKIKLQKELREKKEKERKEQIYQKEFECMKLFNEIDKNKMKSSALYVEYKKILELKNQYNPTKIFNPNILFLDYFTTEKKRQLNELIAKCNPLIIVKQEPTIDENIKIIILDDDTNTQNIVVPCGCNSIIKRGVNKGKICNKKVYKNGICSDHYIQQF